MFKIIILNDTAFKQLFRSFALVTKKMQPVMLKQQTVEKDIPENSLESQELTRDKL